jgi:hypothetical protein
VTIAHDRSSTYGYAGAFIWSTAAQMVEYGYEDSDWSGYGADPLVAATDMLKDGLALAVWDSFIGTPSVTYFGNTNLGAAGSHAPCAAWTKPGSSSFHQSVSAQDGFGGNDGQTLLMMSLAQSRFNINAPSKRVQKKNQSTFGSGTTQTVSGVALGAYTPDRRIIVAVTGSASLNGASTISSVTVGGVSATQITKASVAPSSNPKIAAIYAVDVSDEVADVVVNFTHQFNSCSVAVYTAYGITSTAAADSGSVGASASGTITLTAQPSGIAVACGLWLSDESADPQWSGIKHDGVSNGISGVKHSHCSRAEMLAGEKPIRFNFNTAGYGSDYCIATAACW